MQRNVAILVFDDVEVLDFCGPFEVFSVTGRRDGSNPFNVYTVAEQTPVAARNALSVNPHFLLETCPPPDILVVPGGGGFDKAGKPFGSRREMHNARLLTWLKTQAERTELILSVCTGALILANTGLLSGLGATTHHGAFDALAEAAPDAVIHRHKRIVDNGKVVLSGGISAGIDASFHVVSRLHGETVAQETAKYMEYDWQGTAQSLASERPK